MEHLIRQDLIGPEGLFKETEIKNIFSVSGGCIHKSWHIELLDGRNFFVKTASSENFPMLKFEADCLKILSDFNDNEFIKIPSPIHIRKFKDNSILLLPWLELKNGDQTNLGKGLALIHKISKEKNIPRFGWNDDGFIGMNLQKGGWGDNWGEYFINFRLKPQFEIAIKHKVLDFEFNEFLPRLINTINIDNPSPSIVHGDLWSGNSGIISNEKGAIFDPASYWADREVDIAMTKLFGGFSSEFYSGYNKVWKLSSSMNERIDIYNLYHIINHANLFGGSYIEQTVKLINTINIQLNN